MPLNSGWNLDPLVHVFIVRAGNFQTYLQRPLITRKYLLEAVFRQVRGNKDTAFPEWHNDDPIPLCFVPLRGMGSCTAMHVANAKVLLVMSLKYLGCGVLGTAPDLV